VTSTVLSNYAATLQGLQRRERRRFLMPQRGIDFTSNDFLALANSQRLKKAIEDALARGVPVGSGGSRLLRGNTPEHEALEEEAAEFFGAQRVLFFGSGFAANSALFSTLPQRGDLILYDSLIHASAHEGIAAGKADTVEIPHNDVGQIEWQIRQWRKTGGRGRPWIAVETLYSMEGDRAPLNELAELADSYDGILVVDEAHATGVFGHDGKGFASELEGKENVIALHTCGKALGVSGALLALPTTLAEYLMNRARSFIYSTSPSPLVAAAVREALRALEDEPERRQALSELVVMVGERLKSQFGIEPSGSQIQPVVLGSNARALRVADALQANGYDVRAIRPPTVPDGTARLRLSITLNVDAQQVSAMLDCLAVALEDHPS